MLLDEPTQGMGHEDVHRVAELIKRVSAGRTILMVEHNMSVVSTIADTITVLQRGAVLAEGPYAEVSKNPQVMEAYMGTTGRPTAGSPLMTAALEIKACRPGTARSHVLHGVDMVVQPRRGRDAAGPQWRGPHHHAARDHGPDRRAARAASRSTGRETIAMPTHRIAHLGIGYRPEERGIFASLSCEENLMLPPELKGAGRACRSTRSTRCSRTRRSAATARARGCRAASSRCWRWRASCARAPSCCCSTRSPKGLAPVIVQALARMITTLRSKGYTIVMVEQNFRFAAPLADRFYVMEHGRIARAVRRRRARSQDARAQRAAGRL